jgi:hypothetical protein
MLVSTALHAPESLELSGFGDALEVLEGGALLLGEVLAHVPLDQHVERVSVDQVAED